MTRVLSYGAGVQTTALLRMILANEHERPDAVIFADTQDEPAAVYTSLVRERAACAAAGLPFYVVTQGRLSDEVLSGQVRVPAYTWNGTSIGRMFRSCTDHFKIRPIRRFLRAMQWNDVELWLGISTDEIHRAKPSAVKWISNRYPLIDANIRRSDCEAYLRRHGIEPVKSACVYCPFRSHAAWDDVRRVPEDWKRALAFDARLRDARPGFKTYVHRAAKPLANAVADPSESLFDDECSGYCGT